MNIREIRLYLTHRYVHGHPLVDNKYTKIKEELYDKIKTRENTQTLEEILNPIIGTFNDMNAGIYIELAAQYLRIKTRKLPQQDAVFKVINGYDNP